MLFDPDELELDDDEDDDELEESLSELEEIKVGSSNFALFEAFSAKIRSANPAVSTTSCSTTTTSFLRFISFVLLSRSLNTLGAVQLYVQWSYSRHLWHCFPLAETVVEFPVFMIWESEVTRGCIWP